MTSSRAPQLAITVVMNIVLALALVLLVRVAVDFFGAVAAREGFRTFIALTESLALPFGFPSPRTPYGGIFDSDAAATILVLLVIEWGLSVTRWRG